MSQINKVLRQGLEELLVAVHLAWKDAKIYYLKPPVIMSSFFFPGFMYLAFTIGRVVEPALLIPGLAAITSFFAGGSVGPAVLPLERRTKTLERLLGAPISPFTIIMGKTFGGAGLGLITSLAPLLFGIIWFGIRPTEAILLIPSIVLVAFTFAAFGIFFSARAEDMPNAFLSVNLIRFPMLFVSGVFVPMESMSGLLRFIAYLMPLTYAVDALRQTMLGTLEPWLLLRDLAALSLFLVLFLGAATIALRREVDA